MVTMNDVSDSVFDIHLEDARNLKSKLTELFGQSENIVDAIITSPPYADMQDYGDQDGQIGEQPYEEFLDDLREIFKQCYDVANDESTLWIITDTFHRNNRLVRPPFDIANDLENLEDHKFCPDKNCNGRLQRDRGTGLLYCDVCSERINPLSESWQLKDHIIWNKQRTRPWRKKGQLRNVYEHISMFAKTNEFKYNADDVRIEDTDEFGRWWVDYPERYHPKGKLPDNIWEFAIPKQGEWGPKLNYHPSPFPDGLVERIVKLVTDPGDVILDPFAGVGSTLAVAKRLNRRPIGFELNEQFIDYYHEYVLPTVGRPPTEQQKLVQDNQRAPLSYLIWTLRIHKYAFQLQRELITNDEFDVERNDLIAGLIVTDDTTLDGQDPPQADVYFLGTQRLSDFSDNFGNVADSMVSENRGSGDYYEVDFNISAYEIDHWFDSIASKEIDQSDINPLYIYSNGIHHWFQTKMTVSEWESVVKTGEWKRYQSNSWCPLASTLQIQIQNPQNDIDIGTDNDQSMLNKFNE